MSATFPRSDWSTSVRKCIIRPRMDTISHGIAGSDSRALACRTGRTRARRFVLGAVAAMRAGPRLPVLLERGSSTCATTAAGRTRSWCCRCSPSGSPSSAKIVLRGTNAPADALALRRDRDRVAHRLRLDHVASERCSGRPSRGRATRSTGCSSWIRYFTGIVVASLVLSPRLPRARRAGSRPPASGLLAPTSRSARSLHARALAIWQRMDAPPAGATVAVAAAVPLAVPLAGTLRDEATRSTSRSSTSGRSRAASTDPQPPKRVDGDRLSSLSDSYPPPERARIQSYEQPPAVAGSLEAARALPGLGVYIDFARFPLETVYPEPDGGADGHRPGPALPAVVHGALGARRRRQATPPAAVRVPGAARRGATRRRAGLRPQRRR